MLAVCGLHCHFLCLSDVYEIISLKKTKNNNNLRQRMSNKRVRLFTCSVRDTCE